MKRKGRIIYHVDMNSFYASVEMAYRPELKGKPVAIAGNPEERRGIVVTSSYEARAKGVKTTMPLWQAYDHYPELIVLKPNFDRYREASRSMFSILSKFTPIVQPVSIDEGYMDVTDYVGNRNPVELAKSIQKRILDELDLPSSIGIAPNKFLAKMASNMKKPLGITVLRKREIKDKLWNLPIGEMYGVGQKTEEKLRKIDIETIGNLAQKDVLTLKNLLGINGERLHQRANGIDDRPVDPDAVNEFKSIGNSTTLPYDMTDQTEINKVFMQLSEKVAARMDRKGVVSENIQIMIRYHDRKTITRSKQLTQFVETTNEIVTIAKQLFQQHWNEEPIRLLGVTAQHLTPKDEMAKQLDLFNYEKDAEKEELYLAVDKIKEKYGKDAFIKPKDHQAELNTSFQKDFLNEYKEK
ncbi:DNA polymerase IV [Tenuibacillus multivorans]|uniref:DNA polymerase IV n=1 Tax=Tenuibacillus multivorans TaxID=237069 RepID=A0A1G9Z423_9BACI|nr:DNA polymerase IV [Tenuibacillus multivorans]GEL77414.1 DNA polymerase IV 1 [Tenuibacillus multivorans]SDN16092.1 DNA polymerase-4 [Tenuibacillus multivorans]